MKMAMDAVKSHNELKRKERVPEVIEISSDSETEIWAPKVRHAARLRSQPYGLQSQRQKLDEHAESPHDTNDRPGEPGDILELEADFSRAELHSPSPSDRGHSDDDDDGCIDFLASLDISNEANVMWRVVVFKLEYSWTCFVIVGSPAGKKQSRRFDADARVG